MIIDPPSTLDAAIDKASRLEAAKLCAANFSLHNNRSSETPVASFVSPANTVASVFSQDQTAALLSKALETIAAQSQSLAAAANRGPSKAAPSSSSADKSVRARWTTDGRPICDYCGNVGHIKAACRKRLGQQGSQSQSAAKSLGATENLSAYVSNSVAAEQIPSHTSSSTNYQAVIEAQAHEISTLQEQVASLQQVRYPDFVGSVSSVPKRDQAVSVPSFSLKFPSSVGMFTMLTITALMLLTACIPFGEPHAMFPETCTVSLPPSPQQTYSESMGCYVSLFRPVNELNFCFDSEILRYFAHCTIMRKSYTAFSLQDPCFDNCMWIPDDLWTSAGSSEDCVDDMVSLQGSWMPGTASHQRGRCGDMVFKLYLHS